MSTERLVQLKAFLAEEPGDAFLRYAIGLELKRLGNTEEAIEWLRALNSDKPEHVPTYYQLASLLAELGRGAEALAACDAGALHALVAGDRKARAELIALKQAIEPEDE
ncbi:MAG: tetratricopeptide repeat protein [Flavobacteriales bacterium]|nr:tetratricopeptide repeat protein [Flavobacteriales bacterium]